MQSVMKLLGLGIDKGVDRLSFLGGFFLLFSSFIITIEVLTRAIFGHSSAWISEVSILLVLMSVFITIAYGLKKNSHVNVEVLTSKVSKPIFNALQLASLVLSIAIAVLFTRYYIISAAEKIRIHEVTQLAELPIAPFAIVVVIGCIFFALMAIKMIADNKYTLKKTEDENKKQFSIVALILFFVIAAAIVLLGAKVSITAGVLLMLVYLLLAGVPVSFSMVCAAFMGMMLLIDPTKAIASVPKLCWTAWEGFTVTALPLFVFLGVVLYKSGMADELFDVCRAWLGHLPGGLAIATITACAVFAAVSGSSVANATTIGMVAVPAMIAYKYEDKLAAGLVAAGGTLGILIPPSSPMVMMGILTGESISDLFIAGLLPGLVLWFLYCVTAVIICMTKKDSYEKLPRATWKERGKATKGAIGVLLLPVIILGGIYSGLCTPTEAAALSVAYVVLYSMIFKHVSLKTLFNVVMESTTTVALVGILTAAGIALTKIITLLQVTQKAVAWLAASAFPAWSVVLAAIILLIILGMFLEGSAIVMLTTPILFPLIIGLGYNPIWFAVLVVICIEIGLLTPPVGLNLFIMKQVSGVDVLRVFAGSLPFFIMMFVGIALVCAIPQLALWLPSIF